MSTLDDMMAALQLSDEDKKQARNMGLVNFGLALMGGQKGREFETIGRAGLLGAGSYQNQLQEMRRGKQDDFKLREYAQGVDDKRQAAMAGQQLNQQLANFNPQAGMGSRSGSIADAAQIPNQWEGLMQKADIAANAGDEKRAEAYRKAAEFYRPKFSTTPQVGMRDGKAGNFVIDEQGNSRSLDFAPAPKFREVAGGGVTHIVNDYNLPSAGQSFAKTISPDSQLSADTTRRGQDMTDTRAREFNAITRAGQGSGNVGELRKEFNGLPQVKAYNEVQPALQSAREALGTDTAAADMNLVYAAAKIMDPTSVVRESETAMVMATGSPAQKYMGMFNHVAGGGRLTPEVRKNLMAQIESRGRGYESSYKASRKAYEGIATKGNIPHDQVFIEPFAGGNPPPAPQGKTVVQTGTEKGTGRKVVKYSDGTVGYQ